MTIREVYLQEGFKAIDKLNQKISLYSVKAATSSGYRGKIAMATAERDAIISQMQENSFDGSYRKLAAAHRKYHGIIRS